MVPAARGGPSISQASRPLRRHYGGVGRVKVIGVPDTRPFQESLLDTELGKALQTLLVAEPDRIDPQAARRVLDFVRSRCLTPLDYLRAVTAANRHGLVEESFDLVLQMLREVAEEAKARKTDTAPFGLREAKHQWISSTIMEAMKVNELAGRWRSTLCLLERAKQEVDLGRGWSSVYLAASNVCQELQWERAMSILEAPVLVEHVNELGEAYPEALIRCGAMARWSMALATWKAVRKWSSASDQDAKGKQLIEACSCRMDRSAAWSLSLAIISELRRSRVQSPGSLRAARTTCSKSSQWSAVLMLQGLIQDVSVLYSGLVPNIDPAFEPHRWQRDYLRNKAVDESFDLIKACSRGLLWNRAQALLAALPSPRKEVGVLDEAALLKAYHQTMIALSRSSERKEAAKVFKRGFVGRSSGDRLLMQAMVETLVQDSKSWADGTDLCNEILQIVDELRQAGLEPNFLTLEAMLQIFEDKGRADAAVNILHHVQGRLATSARPSLRQSEFKVKAKVLKAARFQRRVDLEEAWQILEAHGKADAQSHQILQRRMGLFCWQLLERHQLSRLTSRSLLKEHCHLPLQAPWQLLGKGKVRKQLWSSAVLDQEEDAQWCGYAWIQFKVFVPVPQHLVDRTAQYRGLRPFAPRIGRWLSCRARMMGNKWGPTIASQDPEHYGPPLAVRNALLQVLGMAQRPFFGQVCSEAPRATRRGHRHGFGFIECEELGRVFFARRHLPHSRLSVQGQNVSFSLDFNRHGLSKAVNLELEDTIPPLEVYDGANHPT
ncbi:unnamed protein product [Durusdinium trenchii]|uniref:Uncharacterized protein n=1 Tax=Durusdinium trenchii TaxID=1381693 RepID=A0ABP0PWQ1_9DINO